MFSLRAIYVVAALACATMSSAIPVDGLAPLHPNIKDAALPPPPNTTCSTPPPPPTGSPLPRPPKDTPLPPRARELPPKGLPPPPPPPKDISPLPPSSAPPPKPTSAPLYPRAEGNTKPVTTSGATKKSSDATKSSDAKKSSDATNKSSGATTKSAPQAFTDATNSAGSIVAKLKADLAATPPNKAAVIADLNGLVGIVKAATTGVQSLKGAKDAAIFTYNGVVQTPQHVSGLVYNLIHDIIEVLILVKKSTLFADADVKSIVASIGNLIAGMLNTSFPIVSGLKNQFATTIKPLLADIKTLGFTKVLNAVGVNA